MPSFTSVCDKLITLWKNNQYLYLRHFYLIRTFAIYSCIYWSLQNELILSHFSLLFRAFWEIKRWHRIWKLLESKFIIGATDKLQFKPYNIRQISFEYNFSRNHVGCMTDEPGTLKDGRSTTANTRMEIKLNSIPWLWMLLWYGKRGRTVILSRLIKLSLL